MATPSASTTRATACIGHLAIVAGGGIEALGLPGWFVDHPCFQSIRGSTSYASALALFGSSPPDVALVAAQLPDADGIEAAGNLKTLWPSVAVVLTGATDRQLPDAIASGIDGLYLDSPDPGDLLRGIIAVRMGRLALDRRLRSTLFTHPALSAEG